MTTMFLILCATTIFGAYFIAGRLACPAVERMPLQQLSNSDVVATLARGWNSFERVH